MLPDDLIDIDDNMHYQFQFKPPKGRMLGSGANGMPVWVDPRVTGIDNSC